MNGYSRVYAKIDLDAICHNMEAMRQLINTDTRIVAVIKTDGYGHGAIEIAKTIEPMEAVWGFAVATAQEAQTLRRHGIQKPILILGYVFSEHDQMLVDQEIRPAVFTASMAGRLSKEAARQNRVLPIHIAIDTGMSRIGYQVTEECADEIAEISKLSNIKIEGIFTHFARADETDKTSALDQFAQFEKMIQWLRERGVEIPLCHCSNSAGIVDLPDVNMDLVRAGITLYGLWPSDEVIKERIDLHPAMELKSRIVYVKELEAGRSISYGGTYITKEKERIATIPVGYGDGYPRSLSNIGYVLIHGKKAPIRGRVCMDQFMVDVTEITEAAIGDEVTLLGRDGEEQITMEQLGELSGRFNYEFACDLGKRIPRVFVKNGEVVATRDEFSI